MAVSKLFEGQSVRLHQVTVDPALPSSLAENSESETRAGASSLGVVTLCRPDRANAFDDLMIGELLKVLQIIEHHARDLRVVIFHGKGAHFCAGADLGWMRKAARLSYDENISDATLLAELFDGLKNIQVPTLGMIHGSVMGGGVGITACLDVVVARDDTKFALSEVKLGLAPAVIMAFLKSKMNPGFLRQHALTGQVFSAHSALSNGLIQQVVSPEEINQALLQQVENLLGGSPNAQKGIKKYLNQLDTNGEDFVGPTCIDGTWKPISLIAGLRTSPEGQEGLRAFFAKSPPPWRADSGWKKRVLDLINQDVAP